MQEILKIENGGSPLKCVIEKKVKWLESSALGM